jgi:hypothetical protein
MEDESIVDMTLMRARDDRDTGGATAKVANSSNHFFKSIPRPSYSWRNGAIGRRLVSPCDGRMVGMSRIDWMVGVGKLILDVVNDRIENDSDCPGGAIRDGCVPGHAPGDRGRQDDVGAVRG